MKKVSILCDFLVNVWTPALGQFALTDFDERSEVCVSNDLVQLDHDVLRHRGQQRHRLTFIKNKDSSRMKRSC